MLHVDEERADQRVDETGREEAIEKARFPHVLKRVARDDEEARIGGRELAIVGPVGFLIDGHRRSPWL